MRWKLVALIGSLAPSAGCTTYKLVGHNLVHEVVQYEDDQKVRHRLRHDASKVWCEITAQYPRRTFSKEFHEGFVDGYADYLDSGGKAAPPIVPPTRFRRSKYYCPEGQALVRDYFAGFKYGSEVACATGQRQFLTVPILLPVQQPDASLSIAVDDKPPPMMPPPPPLPSDEGTNGDNQQQEGDRLGPPMPVPAVPLPEPPAPLEVPKREEHPKADPSERPTVPASGKVRPVSATEYWESGSSANHPPVFGDRPVTEPPPQLPPIPELPTG